MLSVTLSLVYTSTPNGLRTARERFVNQMRVCVDGTANLRCAICKWFTYHLPRTKICCFFARTQRELDAPGVLCSPQVRGKLINRAPNKCRTRTAQRISGALMYTKLYSLGKIIWKCFPRFSENLDCFLIHFLQNFCKHHLNFETVARVHP